MKKGAYYNEFDPFAASWLRELIKDGLIAPGVVDERSITEVSPSDLEEFAQCHFFAGIGGWSIALRLAGWPDDRPVWTGSPPCQPFSVAGNQKGTSDERHLWPAFFDLIREQAPPTVFGEQVASAIRHGWFDDLQTDLENQNYSSAMAVLPACSVGAPQKRDRLWYVANKLANTDVFGRVESVQPLPREQSKRAWGDSFNGGNRSMGHADDARLQVHGEHGKLHIRQPDGSSENGQRTNAGFFDSTLANAESDRLQRGTEIVTRLPEHIAKDGYEVRSRASSSAGISANAWSESKFIYCRDGKARPAPTEPALFPLADGVSNRVGILRGAGNAIVPQVAAEVIKAFMAFECEPV